MKANIKYRLLGFLLGILGLIILIQIDIWIALGIFLLAWGRGIESSCRNHESLERYIRWAIINLTKPGV